MNKYYEAVPAIIQANMDKFAALTGRQYHLFDYIGAPDATDVIVVMGSGALTIASTVEHLIADDRKVGTVIVRLFPAVRPCRHGQRPAGHRRRITVLDRTKEPGSNGDPLYLDVRAAVTEAAEGTNPTMMIPMILNGRYGLGSAEYPGHGQGRVRQHGLVRPEEEVPSARTMTSPSPA